MRTIPRRHFLLAALLIPGACTASTTTPPRPSQSSPPDLAGMVVHPDGYEPIPNDPLSGPLDSPASVANYFAEHPGDAAEILKNGFVSGYAQYWQQTATVTSTGLPNRTLTFTVVIQLATPAAAHTVHAYFRKRGEEDKAEFFPVPDSLSSGYGYHSVQPDQTYLSGVFWVQDSRIFDVGMVYSEPTSDPSEVIARALAQSGSH